MKNVLQEVWTMINELQTKEANTNIEVAINKD